MARHQTPQRKSRKRSTKTNKAWNTNELKYLETNADERTNSQLANELGCRESQVAGAMSNHGIKRSKQAISQMRAVNVIKINKAKKTP